jgi:hypothetical protein
MINLEALTAQAAERMGTYKAKKVVTQSLIVLTQQGLFAFGLFLATRESPKECLAAEKIHRAVAELLNQAGLSDDPKSPLSPDYYGHLTKTRQGENDIIALQRILFTKKIIEMALTYTRNYNKAQREKELEHSFEE